MSRIRAALIAIAGLFVACGTPASTSPTGDAGVGSDAQVMAIEAGCHPIDTTGFSPPAYAIAPVVSNACDGFNADGGLVTSYGEACLGPAATYDSCSAFVVADSGTVSACYACLVAPANRDAGINAAVVPFPSPVVNYSDCIALVDPTDAGASCAEALVLAASCADYACESTCPVTDQASLNAFIQCTNQAAAGTCDSYTYPALLCEAAEQGDGGTAVAATCFAGTTAIDHYLSFAHALCGGQ